MTEREVSVLVVEDDAMVRSWLRLALKGSEFRLAGEASTVAEALNLVERRAPEVLLFDHRLPDGVGTELLHGLRRRGVAVPCVLMTAHPEPGLNEAARDAGAEGTALKSGDPDELLSTLRAVHAGDRSFDARHPRRPPGRGALSPREREVLRMVAAGSTNKQIAAELGVSDETVKTLLGRTFMKLGVRRRAEAVAIGHERGLL